MSASTTPRVALTIAGSDPSGGAGIQADLKTFSALGVYGAAVVTALTAQNTREVRAIHAPPAEFVAAQIDAVFDDLQVAAVKTGMLGSAELIETVAARLRAHRARNVVVDPVMVAKSGAQLLEPDAVRALVRDLVPLADVLTPNLPEAAALLSVDVGEILADRERACRALLDLGARAAVLKGGHAGGAQSEDILHDGRLIHRVSMDRVASENTHGTGCTFSSAIAARLALGDELPDAVRRAKVFVWGAISASRDWRLGSGHGPVHHFHRQW